MVKNPPAKQETRVQSLGREESLEKETATHSSILAWEISWTEEPDGLQSLESLRVRYNLATKQQLTLYFTLYYLSDTCTLTKESPIRFQKKIFAFEHTS